MGLCARAVHIQLGCDLWRISKPPRRLADGLAIVRVLETKPARIADGHIALIVLLERSETRLIPGFTLKRLFYQIQITIGSLVLGKGNSKLYERTMLFSVVSAFVSEHS